MFPVTLRTAAAWLLCLLPAVTPVLSQSTSGRLTGRVTGRSGAAVSGAVVQIRSEETGRVRTALTDDAGRFNVQELQPGRWTVVARTEKGGASASRSFRLSLGQIVRIDLVIGEGLTESVRVEADAVLINPKRTGGEFRIDHMAADALPLAGDAILDLALLDASVKQSTANQFSGEVGSAFVINGQSGRSNTFLVDGMDNNDRTSGTNLNASFSQQAVSEFVVLTDSYAAEYGQATGGVVNFITERGTNEAAGSLRLSGVSSDWGEPGSMIERLPSPPGQRDGSSRFEAGFSLGGPLKRDRAFYFLSVDHAENDQVTPYIGRDRNGVAGGWTVAPNRNDSLFFRTDFNLGDSSFLMTRLSLNDRKTSDLLVGGRVTPESGFRVNERDVQFAASLKTILSPGLIHEIRFLAGDSSFRQQANSDRPGVERPGGLFGGNSLNRQNRDETRFQLVENLTWLHGDHTFKFGLDVMRSVTDLSARFNPNGNFLYETDQPFEPGDGFELFVTDCLRASGPRPCDGIPGVDDDGDGLIDEPADKTTYPVAFVFIDGRPTARLRDWRISAFAQDGWQVNPSFLIDYGVRYELSTFTLPADLAVPSVIPNGGAGKDTNNIAPRAGFTWQPERNGRWVVRGGAGIYYDKLVLAFPGVAAITSGTRVGILPIQGLTFEIDENLVEDLGVEVLIPELAFPDEFVMRFSTGTRLDTPYSTQYSLGFDRRIGRGAAVSAKVIRQLGYHLPLMRDLNPVVNILRPPDDPEGSGIPIHRDSSFGSIAAVVTEGRSWYTGVNLGVKMRTRNSWAALSYTWSRAEDMGPDPLKGGIYLPPNSDDLGLERALSDFDARHRVVLAADTPLRVMGIRGSIILQYSSGVPFNVTTGKDDNQDGILSDRPAGLGRNTGERTDLGDGRRFHQPAFAQVDLKLTRPFLYGNRENEAEVYLQVVNLLNRENGGLVQGQLNNPAFLGRPGLLVGPPRIVELGLRLGF